MLVRVVGVAGSGFGQPLARDAIAPLGPVGQILQLAALAAEGPPRDVNRVAAAQDALNCLRHPTTLYPQGRKGGEGQEGRDG